MSHPNDDFLRKFLKLNTVTDKEEKQFFKKQRVANYYKSLEQKNILIEENKNAIDYVTNKIFGSSKIKTLIDLKESKKAASEWVPVMTPQGVYYYNKQQGLWMNNFGVVQDDLNDFFEFFSYVGVDPNYSNSDPPLPNPTSSLDYEVWATSFVDAPPDWNTENYSTFGIVPMPALAANVNNGYRLPGTSVSVDYANFINTIQTIPETRRVANTYIYWDDLASWTRQKHDYYKNTTDGFTFAGGRFLNPWPDNQYTDCKNHLITILNYLNSQNINLDYFCDDKENVAPLYGLYGYNTGWSTTRPTSFDVNGNPIVAFPSYNGWTLDARIIGSVVLDPRLQSFIDPNTGKSVGQSVIDNYKIISSQPNYTGTAGTLLTRWVNNTSR
jgi:hypothetical protein